MDEKVDMDVEEMRNQLRQYAMDTQELTAQLKASQQQNQLLLQKLDAVSPASGVKKIEHDADFWMNIQNNCVKKTGPFGTDAIKQMIKTGKMTVHDTDHTNFDKTLLAPSGEFWCV